MNAQSDKDIAIARMSFKQAISVAVITLCSAVAVAMIAHYQQSSPKKEDAQETGFYQARSISVEQGFDDAENELKSLAILAEKKGDKTKARVLSQVIVDTRTARAQFELLHQQHINALVSNNRLVAAEKRMEINTLIEKLNREHVMTIPLTLETLEARAKEAHTDPLDLLRVYDRLARARLIIPTYGKHALKNDRDTELAEQQTSPHIATESDNGILCVK